jgi:hypothetical protein
MQACSPMRGPHSTCRLHTCQNTAVLGAALQKARKQPQQTEYQWKYEGGKPVGPCRAKSVRVHTWQAHTHSTPDPRTVSQPKPQLSTHNALAHAWPQLYEVWGATEQPASQSWQGNWGPDEGGTPCQSAAKHLMPRPSTCSPVPPMHQEVWGGHLGVSPGLQTQGEGPRAAVEASGAPPPPTGKLAATLLPPQRLLTAPNQQIQLPAPATHPREGVHKVWAPGGMQSPAQRHPICSLQIRTKPQVEGEGRGCNNLDRGLVSEGLL